MSAAWDKWLKHKNDWSCCMACSLCEGRNHVVLARGSIPCSILFCGEAPGPSDDVIGSPFARGAPAGRLMQIIIDRSVPQGVSYALTNLVACIPRDPDDGHKWAEPPPESIEACTPRLEEFVEIAAPSLIVCVGDLARNWIAGTKGKRHLLAGYRGQVISITHPGAIVRANSAQQGLMVKRAIVTVSNAIEELT